MNLLFVYPQAIVPTRGGTERVAYTVANALREYGHKIFFMATKSGSPDAYLASQPEHILISENLNAEERKQAVITACEKHHIDCIINEGGEFEDFSIFSKDVLPKVKIIPCLHFDVYGEINYFRRDRQFRNLTTSQLKLAIIEMLTAVGIDPYRIKFYLSKRRKYRKMLQVSDAVVVVTPVIAEQLKRLTGINSDKIVPILNPVSFANVQPTYDAAAKEKMLLFVGRFSPDKNVDKILQAWAQIAPQFPEWKLEIAGDGEMRDELHALVQNQQIPRVHFHGHVTEVKPLYERAEYVLLASDCESFSCVVLEGYLHGCYPIVFGYPSAPIVIPDAKLGTIVKSHTSSALARAISRSITNGVSNRQNLAAIRHHLSQFETTKLSAEWHELLQRLNPCSHHNA